jgi:hypothetical protein
MTLHRYTVTIGPPSARVTVTQVLCARHGAYLRDPIVQAAPAHAECLVCEAKRHAPILSPDFGLEPGASA